MIFLLALCSFLFAEEPKLVGEWTEWLLQAHPQKLCITEDRCQWIGSVQIDLDSDQASFVQRGQLDAPSWVQLIGNDGSWPINIQVNGTHVPIIEKDGSPMIFLQKGEYTIKGTIIWNSIPDQLDLPKTIALIAVSKNGLSQDFLIDENHRLLFQSTKKNKQDYQLTVLRKLHDQIPLELETRIIIQVSSHPQIINLGRYLDAPLSLHHIEASSITWFDEAGNLWIQLPIGEHQIVIENSIDANISEISLPTPPEHWPAEEFWVFESNKKLRSIQLENLSSTSVEQTPLPQEWKHLPAYIFDGSAITITEYRKGNPTPPPNQLYLHREVWPRLHQEGFVLKDHITGTMNQDWAVAVLNDLHLTKAENKGTPLPIMQKEDGKYLISQRNHDVNLEVEAISDTTKLPLNGWDTDFDAASITLHLPSGWMLLYSNAPSNDLWIFPLLLSNFLLLTLGLFLDFRKETQQNIDITEFSFQTVGTICAIICAPVATLIWLSISLLLRYWSNIPTLHSALLFFFVIAMCIEINQQQNAPSFPLSRTFIPAAEDELIQTTRAMDYSLDRRIQKSKKFEYKTPSYIVQMGLGTPKWAGEISHHHWSEGISKTQQLSLFIITKTERYFLFLFGLGTLLVFGWLRTQKLKKLLVPFFLLSILPQAQAEEFPSMEWQNQLLERATKKDCATDCSTISLMVLKIADQLQIALEANATTDSYITLPGPSNIWRPEKVLLEGQQYHALREREDGFIEMRIPKGIWNIQLLGPTDEILQLQFADIPKRTDFHSTTWTIEGLLDNGTIQKTIVLQKQQTQQDQQYNPKFRIIRTIDIGVEWRITNQLVREGANNSPIRFSLPLLDNEKMISGALNQNDDILNIELSANEKEFSWNSVLGKSDHLSIVSNDIIPEKWNIRCGAQYECVFSGVTPLEHNNSDGDWVIEYQPLPSETLDIDIAQYQPAPGKTYRIDQVNITNHLGSQQQQSDMEFDIIASQAGTIALTLPPETKIRSLSLNGEAFPFRSSENIVIPYELGSQSVNLSWTVQQTGLWRTIIAPQFSEELSNITIRNRTDKQYLSIFSSQFWWKPFQQSWLLLLFAVGFALGLAKHPKAQLTFMQWSFLLLGLVQWGFIFSTIWLLFFWIQHSWQWNSWKGILAIWFLLIGMTSVGALLILTKTITPNLFLSPASQQWYTDLWQQSIPSITVLLFPRWLFLIGFAMWNLFVFWLAFQSVRRKRKA